MTRDVLHAAKLAIEGVRVPARLQPEPFVLLLLIGLKTKRRVGMAVKEMEIRNPASKSATTSSSIGRAALEAAANSNTLGVVPPVVVAVEISA